MNTSDEGKVIWPKHYKPLPEGYEVHQLDSGHYIWTNSDDVEGLMHWSHHWVRQSAFLHYKAQEQECYPECKETNEACNGCPCYLL